MKPGAIVNISRNQSETGAVLPNDWYREEKWKRILDWMTEIEKETEKSKNEMALLQTRRLRSMLDHIKTKETYKEQEMPAYFIADLERLNRNWDRIVHSRSDSRPKDLEEENRALRKDIDRLETLNRKVRNPGLL
jgi:hypothetical protein